MNWVERKHQRETILATSAPDVWNKVRGSIQDACESYNRLYGTSDTKKVTVDLENGKRIRIEKLVREDFPASGYRDAKITMLVSFEGSPASISVVGDSPVAKSVTAISSDEEIAFIGTAKDRHVEVDAFSQKILEPLLFPKGNYRDPT